MALLRSDEDIKHEIEQLEKELVKYPTGPTRRKIKDRISRLKRMDKERINGENRRRRLGMKKRVPKPKTQNEENKKEKTNKKLVIKTVNPSVEKEIAYIRIDEKLAKDKKSEKKEKHYCSSCGKECVKTYSNINDIYKHKYYCEKCAKKKYGMFEIDG